MTQQYFLQILIIIKRKRAKFYLLYKQCHIIIISCLFAISFYVMTLEIHLVLEENPFLLFFHLELSINFELFDFDKSFYFIFCLIESREMCHLLVGILLCLAIGFSLSPFLFKIIRFAVVSNRRRYNKRK